VFHGGNTVADMLHEFGHEPESDLALKGRYSSVAMGAAHGGTMMNNSVLDPGGVAGCVRLE
jgi:hypothetical protein